MTDQPWEPPEGVDASYALFAKEARVRVDDGTSIAYTFRNPTGRSIPLLFANGWSCSDAYWGKLVTDLEARGHPCLVPDTRGHGASGLPRSPGRGAKNLSLSDVSIPRVARDLVAVLDDVDDVAEIHHVCWLDEFIWSVGGIPARGNEACSAQALDVATSPASEVKERPLRAEDAIDKSDLHRA